MMNILYNHFPHEIFNQIRMFAHPRLNDDLQNDIKKFEFIKPKICLRPFWFNSINCACGFCGGWNRGWNRIRTIPFVSSYDIPNVEIKTENKKEKDNKKKNILKTNTKYCEKIYRNNKRKMKKNLTIF
jgi:hypothetical protein